MARPKKEDEVINDTNTTLQDGVEKVGEGATDTTKRAYHGTSTNKYPFEPDPNLHYLLVREWPENLNMESQFDKWTREGYKLVQYVGNSKTAAWFSIPLDIWKQRQAESRKVRDATRDRARAMAKTGDPNRSDVSTWVAKDEYSRGGGLINKPISYDG